MIVLIIYLVIQITLSVILKITIEWTSWLIMITFLYRLGESGISNNQLRLNLLIVYRIYPVLFQLVPIYFGVI